MCFGESHFDENDKNYLLKNVNFKPSRHGLLLSDANLGKLFSLFNRTVIITKIKKQSKNKFLCKLIWEIQNA